MTDFVVSPMTLAPVDGIHQGTGTQRGSNWVVDPTTVAGSAPLVFVTSDLQATTMLFRIDAPVVPNWFGVAAPSRITSFGDPVLFFHPTPAQAGYVDADYATKSGKWPELFYYMDRLGYQLDAARKDRVIIMPFLTEGATDTGILPGAWRSLVTEILTGVRAEMGRDDGSPLAIASLAVASFSAGIVYSDAFRRRATDLAPLLREVWDLDGSFSTNGGLSAKLQSTAGVRVTKYDQVQSPASASFHVPQARWSGYPAPVTSGGEVHGLVCSFMVTHASWLSPIGARAEA
jgi:hypothetical protein